MGDLGFQPTCVDHITTEYLNATLKGFQKIEKIEFHTPTTHGGMSKVSKIILHYNPEEADQSLKHPPSIFVKFSSKANENFLNKSEKSDIMRHGELYKREIMLNNYFKDSTLSPEIYFTQIDDSQDFIMLMEDCASLDDIKTGVENSVQKEISVDKARIAIRDIAEFHGQFYHENNKDRLECTKGILCGNLDNYFKEKELAYVPELFAFLYYTNFYPEFSSFESKQDFATYNEENLQRICEFHQKKFNGAVEFMLSLDLESLNTDRNNFNLRSKITKIKNSSQSFTDRFKISCKYLIQEAPTTLVHNDFRSDNMCFVAGKMKLFDLQCVVVGSGLIDVASLFLNSMPVDDVFEHEDELLHVYFETVNKINPNVWENYEEFHTDYIHALYYQFRNIILFSESVSALPKDFSVIGVSYDSLMAMYFKSLTRVINAVSKHCYQ